MWVVLCARDTGVEARSVHNAMDVAIEVAEAFDTTRERWCTPGCQMIHFPIEREVPDAGA